jgi:oligopeptide transport system permease protein
MKKVFKILSLIYLSIWMGLIIYAKLILPAEIQSSEVLIGPSAQHIFGTDALGRDLFHRILEGGFVSFSVGLISSIFSLALACLIGVLWTWYRPKSSFVLLGMDILQALPSYVLSSLVFLLIQKFFGSAIAALSVALAITHWMNAARILRAQTLQLHVSPFVEAARALGGTSWHVLKHHVPAHLRNTILVLWALQIPVLLMYESFMSFIGFGVEAPHTSWGLLLQEGWRYLSDYPHLLLGPGFVLFTVLFALNYLLDSTRYTGMPEGKIAPPKADSKAAATEIAR